MQKIIKTINPFNNNFLANYQYLNEVEISEAVNVSQITFTGWKNTNVKERVDFIKTLGFVLTKQQHLLAKTCVLEMGKPLKQALAEVQKCGVLCDFYAENAEDFLAPETIKSDAAESYVTYEPLGVILGVMPWNFPYWQVFRFAVPAILAGNTVLVKHASNVAGCAQLLEDIFLEAGFPKGVYQNLLIASGQVEEVINNPIIKAVSLTGSEKAGAAVASTAAKQIKKAVLELGGSNAFIVCEDANVEDAVSVAVTARMQNTGQSCIAAKRFLVHDSVFDIFVEKFRSKVEALQSGDPMLETTDIGPLARVDLAEDVEKQVNKSVEMGAKVVTGGTREGAFYSPTVLINVTTDMPVFKEEVFGPAVPVVPFSSFEEAVNLSNQSEFGLGVTIFSKDVENIKRKAHLFEEGAVFINAMVKSDPALPFGGVKRSGYGRELAENGIKEFVNVKTIYIK
ncbi:NAD-dependent succinate-semialdehyde dehydrogenase [Flavobacterium sp. AG291]|uniref:NAD-dependent succinate-semialdehyde dehydrogenase n=1 Tax=Flavobacterium sp. AG291 TaxID=2184000 RepID=UPI000E2DD092|nr:NAD-dependent succinate-semialdehyde dehydrogenase [Flavobacterium sp. AG291]RDI14510.1 succinate-semialdehyde dehydrogenase/glutarate-semialdehyde dehydrogenase [Flavobacterium sp. AG291]